MVSEVFGTAKVRGKAVRRAWKGHPWLAAEDCLSVEDAEGPFVDLVDENSLPLGTALYDAGAEIPIRLVASARTHDPIALLRTRLERAEARRRTDLLGADAYRLCHGEGDGVPRLFVDRFGDGLCVTSVTPSMTQVATELFDPLVEITGAKKVVHWKPAGGEGARTRHRRDAPFEAELVRGDDAAVRFHHGGLVRSLDLTSSFDVTSLTAQLDIQRFARRWARGRVLDAGSGVGGTGLQLADAGAQSVTFVDEDDDIRAMVERDAKSNGLSSRVDCVAGSPMEELRRFEREGERFHVLVSHPPELREPRGDGGARRRVHERSRQALKLLDEGGILITWPGTTALDGAGFEQLLVDAAARGRKRLQVLARLQAGPDYPTLVGTPDRTSTTLVARVLSHT